MGRQGTEVGRGDFPLHKALKGRLLMYYDRHDRQLRSQR